MQTQILAYLPPPQLTNPSDASCAMLNDQVLVIAHFLNSVVRVSIASGWNANPQLAKVMIKWKRNRSSDSSNGVGLFDALGLRAHVYTFAEPCCVSVHGITPVLQHTWKVYDRNIWISCWMLPVVFVAARVLCSAHIHERFADLVRRCSPMWSTVGMQDTSWTKPSASSFPCGKLLPVAIVLVAL